MRIRLILYAVVFTLWFTGPRAEGCFRSSHRNSADQNNKISVKGSWMVDSYGRVRIFHGFNAVKKEFPWYSDKLGDEYLKYYKEWGFTAVRMGAMWSGVQPAEGVTNDTYIEIVKDIVVRAGKRGIYSLLDMHQDVISTKFDAYDGVPRWVIDKMPPSKHPYPFPLARLSQWADGYLTEAVGNAFQCLYDNVAGSRDSMAKFWETVADNFKSFDTVLGYELINEPWAGNIYRLPELLLPGNAGHKNLEPLYDFLNKAIRRIDNETLIFYEPVTWGMVFPGNGSTGNGFHSVPGGPAYTNKSVMSWHYYCWILAIDDTHPYAGFQRTVCDTLLGTKVFKTVRQDVQRTGGASFLTEFGLCSPNNNSQEAQTIECEFILNMADKNLQSWAYWDSDFFNVTTGEIRADLVRHFARVYASATAGTPLQMRFNLASRQFTFIFSPDNSIKAPTEIIVPPLQYPNGFVVKLSSGYQWEYDEVNFVVRVTPSKTETRKSSDVTIFIGPK